MEDKKIMLMAETSFIQRNMLEKLRNSIIIANAKSFYLCGASDLHVIRQILVRGKEI